MNSDLNHTLARQRAAELQRAADRRRLASEVSGPGTRPVRAPHHSPGAPATGFTLRGHDLAKLDRFLVHAKRSALRDDREFDGVSIEVDAHGIVSVHAIGMRSIVL
jgi:hypothetical protein